VATKDPRLGEPGKKAPQDGDSTDNKVESNQRMAWVEQGGIDLREARKAKGPVTRQKDRKG
jgi:hypothetical protein